MSHPQAPGPMRRLLTFCRWELYLVWPVFVILVYAAFFAETGFLSKTLHEVLAPVLLGLAGLVFLTRWVGERQPLVLILLALDVALFCRELHFAGTSKGIYVALLLVAVWSVLWWQNIASDIIESKATPYLLFALATYVLSQTIARRVFRGILPLEAESDFLRTGLEESLENLAHLSMLVVAMLGFSRGAQEDDDPGPPQRRTGDTEVPRTCA
jgi:hypothetical protein